MDIFLYKNNQKPSFFCNFVVKFNSMMLQVALYLIPTNISDAPLTDVLPAYNMTITKQLRYFIVENLRTARRFFEEV